MKKRLIISLIIFIISIAILTTLCIVVRKNNLDPLFVDVWARDLAYNTRGEKGGFNYWFWRIFTEFGDLYGIAVLCVLMLIYTKLDYRFMIFLFNLYSIPDFCSVVKEKSEIRSQRQEAVSGESTKKEKHCISAMLPSGLHPASYFCSLIS